MSGAAGKTGDLMLLFEEARGATRKVQDATSPADTFRHLPEAVAALRRLARASEDLAERFEEAHGLSQLRRQLPATTPPSSGQEDTTGMSHDALAKEKN